MPDVVTNFREYLDYQFARQVIWRKPDLTQDPPECFTEIHKWAKYIRQNRRKKHIYAEHIEKRILFLGKKPRNFINAVEHAEIGTIYPKTTKFIKNLVDFEKISKNLPWTGGVVTKVKNKFLKKNVLVIPIIINDIYNNRQFILTGNHIIAYLTQIRKVPVGVLIINYHSKEGKVFNGTPFHG